jgi:hypothetical protein
LRPIGPRSAMCEGLLLLEMRAGMDCGYFIALVLLCAHWPPGAIYIKLLTRRS